MTVWSIFVIVICIPQFLYSLNMKFKKKIGRLTFFRTDFELESRSNYDSAFQLVCFAPKIFCRFISGLLLQLTEFYFTKMVETNPFK